MFIFQIAGTVGRNERVELQRLCRGALDQTLNNSQLEIGATLNNDERRNQISRAIADEVRRQYGRNLDNLDPQRLGTIVRCVTFDILISRASNTRNREILERDAVEFYRSKISDLPRFQNTFNAVGNVIDQITQDDFVLRNSLQGIRGALGQNAQNLRNYVLERMLRNAVVEEALGINSSDVLNITRGVADAFSYMAAQTQNRQTQTRLFELEIQTVSNICQRPLEGSWATDLIRQGRVALTRGAFAEASSMLVGAINQELMLNPQPDRLRVVPRATGAQMVFEAGGVVGFARALERTRGMNTRRAEAVAHEVENEIIRMLRSENVSESLAQRAATQVLTTAANRMDGAHNFQGETVDPNNAIVTMAIGLLVNSAVERIVRNEREEGYRSRLSIPTQRAHIYRFDLRGESYEIGSRIPIENLETLNGLLESARTNGRQIIAVRNSQNQFLDGEDLTRFANDLLISIAETNRETPLAQLRAINWRRELNATQIRESGEVQIPQRRENTVIDTDRERYVQILRNAEMRNGLVRADDSIYQRGRIYVYSVNFPGEEIQIISLTQINPTVLDQSLGDLINGRTPIMQRTRTGRSDGVEPRTHVAILSNGRLLSSDEERAVATRIREINRDGEFYTLFQSREIDGPTQRPNYQRREEVEPQIRTFYVYSFQIGSNVYQISSANPIQTYEQLTRAVESAQNAADQIYLRRGNRVLERSELQNVLAEIQRNIPQERELTSIRATGSGLSGFRRMND